MTWRIYSDAPFEAKPTKPVPLPALRATGSSSGEGYVPDKALADAVNVALWLSQPLLVTGEPGTGKTQLAFSVAAQLGLDPPLVFNTKTTSVARDLFYRYDALRHFRDSHLGRVTDGRAAETDPDVIERSMRTYIDYEALGLAILLSMPREDVRELLPPEHRDRQRGRSVVLIDEIDKAPRDVPNDVLHEFEAFGFTVKETGREFKAPEEYRPIVILTSNSERMLPEPFLRRCVFHHLSFPGDDQLRRIIRSRLGEDFSRRPWIDRAIAMFLEVRDLKMDKKPATAEFLSWLRFLDAYGQERGRDPLAEGFPEASDSIMAKTQEGLKKLRENRPA